MKYRKSLVGERFGSLLVIEKMHVRGKNSSDTKYLCKCDCGTEKVIRYTNLINKNTVSCGCFRRKIAGDRNRGIEGHASRRSVWIYYKRNARIRNIEWKLSEDKFYELISGNCAYCNSAPLMEAKTAYDKGFIHNGVDRIDSNKGYEEGNLNSCCTICNRAKGNMSLSAFLSWVKCIKDNQT